MSQYIYALSFSDESVFYIGRTNNPLKRRAAHRAIHGAKMQLRVLEKVAKGVAVGSRETHWINYHNLRGQKLRNKNPGSTPGARLTSLTVTLPSPLLMRLIKKARGIHQKKRAVSLHVRGLIEKDLTTK